MSFNPYRGQAHLMSDKLPDMKVKYYPVDPSVVYRSHLRSLPREATEAELMRASNAKEFDANVTIDIDIYCACGKDFNTSPDSDGVVKDECPICKTTYYGYFVLKGLANDTRTD